MHTNYRLFVLIESDAVMLILSAGQHVDDVGDLRAGCVGLSHRVCWEGDQSPCGMVGERFCGYRRRDHNAA